ncbi:MAG: sporulation initiation factor Spo0A C-terminal domain-containing protein, partial [Ruminococcus sp.]|nr:sporulation initiation factor Spo0A C-terminal domain-containing protein [Ruminococcus sp.]
GINRYFTTNTSLNDVCFGIIKDLFEKDSNISVEIIEFLEKLGFPCYMNSFFIVCLSVQRLLENPKNFTNFSKYLYPLIEKDLNTTSYWVERGIRYMSHIIHKKGIYFDCYQKDSALENKVFLHALVNEFKKSKGENTDNIDTK